jgi:hypothetical protein
MYTRRLEQSLAIAVLIILALLLVGVFGFGIAIRQGAVVPPSWEVQLYTIDILAYGTDYPDCPPTTLCPTPSIASLPAFYVVWRINEVVAGEQPDSRRSMARRLLAVPLKD